MQISLIVPAQGEVAGVGFVFADYLPVCVRPVLERLMNADFSVLAHILNFTHTAQFRRDSTN